MAYVHDPGGVGFRIETLWAFLSVSDDEGDDDEGVMAFVGKDGVFYPMIAADPARLEQLRPLAESLASAGGKRVVLARFTTRTDLETFGDDGVKKASRP